MKIDKSRLLHSQIELLETGFMDSNQNWVICAPTGAGKTRMGEWVLDQAALCGRKGIYLAPLKAIVEEKSTALVMPWVQSPLTGICYTREVDGVRYTTIV